MEVSCVPKSFHAEDVSSDVSSMCVATNKSVCFLNCRLCEKILNVPITLVCGHTFCTSCLAPLRDTKNNVLCPICGTSFTDCYSVNITIRELTRKLPRNFLKTGDGVMLLSDQAVNRESCTRESNDDLSDVLFDLAERSSTRRYNFNLKNEQMDDFLRKTCQDKQLLKSKKCNMYGITRNLDGCQPSPKSVMSRHYLEQSIKDELQCKMCFCFMFKPVTTPCGHSFCLSCLSRNLDHRFECPLCRTNLSKYLEFAIMNQYGVCDILEQLLCEVFPNEYNVQRIAYEQELMELKSFASENNQAEIPIFVCTLALPDIPCPLHIFEPRYKLMIRQCMESGAKQFGMCVADKSNTFASIGTMLKIQKVEYLPDGRSIVDTIGGKRFKVLSRGTRDGYNTATVEWLVDENNDHAEQLSLVSEVDNMMRQWYSNLATVQQNCIDNALGMVPSYNDATRSNSLKWIWWLLAALPLNIEAKLIILRMTSQSERLISIKRFLHLLLNLGVTK